MADTAKSLYDTDFAEWSARTAALIRSGRFQEIDAENVAEEIESLGKAEHSAVRSQMLRLLLHQIKRRIQPEKETASWRRSILDSQDKLQAAIEDSPSLTGFLHVNLERIYQKAVYNAHVETKVEASVPERCPFTVGQLLQDFDLQWPD